MRKFAMAVSVSLVAALSGCATCFQNETDARKASTCQMIVHDGPIKDWQKKQREYLVELQSTLINLDEELLTSRAELYALQGRLDQLEIPEKELQQLQQDISDMEKEQAQLEGDILLSKEDINTLDEAIANSKAIQPELEGQRDQARQRVTRMEKKLEVIKNGVKRAVAISLKT